MMIPNKPQNQWTAEESAQVAAMQIASATPKPRAGEHEKVCDVCGGRASACRVLGHRQPGDNTQWQAKSFMPDEWGSFQFTTSADAKRAEVTFNRLSSENDALCEALDQLATGMEQIAKAMPEVVAYMPGIKWMPERARKLLTKHGR